MEPSELKVLLSDSTKFRDWSSTYFNEYSKDNKFITSFDFNNIVTSLCDEYGIEPPSKDEIEAIMSKRKKENESSINRRTIINNIDDELSFDEYLTKISIVCEIIVIKLEN